MVGIVISFIFLCRKKRYERYRIRIVLRMFIIHNVQEKANDSQR